MLSARMAGERLGVVHTAFLKQARSECKILRSNVIFSASDVDIRHCLCYNSVNYIYGLIDGCRVIKL